MGIKEVIVSELTEEHLLKQYPHLTREQMELLFIEGDIQQVSRYKLFSIQMLRGEKVIQRKLHVPKELADQLNVDRSIDVIPGEDGMVCTFIC